MKCLVIVVMVTAGLFAVPTLSLAEFKYTVYFTDTNSNTTAEDQSFGSLDLALKRADELILHRDDRTVVGTGKVWVEDSLRRVFWPKGEKPAERRAPNPPAKPKSLSNSTWHRDASQVQDKYSMYGFVLNGDRAKTANVLLCTKGAGGRSGQFTHDSRQSARWNAPGDGTIYINIRHGSYSFALRGRVKGDTMKMDWYYNRKLLRTETYLRQ